EVTSRRTRLQRREQVYELHAVETPVPEQGRLRAAGEADAELVARWWHEFSQPIFPDTTHEECDRAARQRIADGDVFVWDVGRPVSMAAKTRPTRSGISVGPVYTPPE